VFFFYSIISFYSFFAEKIRSLKDEIETAKEKSQITKHISHQKTPLKVSQDEKDQKNGDKKKQNKKLSKKDRPKLSEGTEIHCNNGGYIVEQLLGSGGFGDVYKAKKIGTNEYYAIKTELNEFNGKKIDRLKIEVAVMIAFKLIGEPQRKKHFVQLFDKGQTDTFKLIVMQLLGPSIEDLRRHILCTDFTYTFQIEVAVMIAFKLIGEPQRKKHFVQLFDKGQTDTFKLIVMQLLGPSIEDLRRHILCTDFTRPTAMRISQQALEGIWDLHLVGFIHRDIKPQNFAIGIGDKNDLIYVLDLGIAHRFIDKHTNKIKYV
uniref:Protein kinase domain-containing protein n=1 Tax=Ascaris lumbricoides TaxID=6252 RepID=A0A0M3IVN4_ASCLU